jgi:hypothetical protein
MISQARLIACHTSTVMAVRAARALSRAPARQERIELGFSSPRVRKRRALNGVSGSPSAPNAPSAPTTLSALRHAWPPSGSWSSALSRIVASTRRQANSARSMKRPIQ